MSNRDPTPYVAAEVRAGRLVRVCPACNEHIVEHTDHEGLVSNRFAEHYRAEHPVEPEPKKQRMYVLAPESGPGDRHTIGRIACEHAQKSLSGDGVECQLVDRFEDLPESTPTVLAAHVILSSWAREGDPPHFREIRWYERDGDKLVFTPTEKQSLAYAQASRRLMDARYVLLDRHREELPTFADDGGDFDAAWERFRARTEPLERAITNDLDKAQDAARSQFYTGRTEWLATINDAICAADVSEDEIGAKREWFDAREAEAREAVTTQARKQSPGRSSGRSRPRAARGQARP
jgi:hypothetical protein